MSLLPTVCSGHPPTRPTPRGSKFGARRRSHRQSALDRRIRRCRGGDSGDQRLQKPRSTDREQPEDDAECFDDVVGSETTASPHKKCGRPPDVLAQKASMPLVLHDEVNTQCRNVFFVRPKHGLVTAVAFAALAGALAVCDIDAHDVLPHFTDLQLSLLLDELDYTTLMLIDFTMRHVAGLPPLL